MFEHVLEQATSALRLYVLDNLFMSLNLTTCPTTSSPFVGVVEDRLRITINSISSMDPVILGGVSTWYPPVGTPYVGTSPPQSFFDIGGIGTYWVSNTDWPLVTSAILSLDNLTYFDLPWLLSVAINITKVWVHSNTNLVTDMSNLVFNPAVFRELYLRSTAVTGNVETWSGFGPTLKILGIDKTNITGDFSKIDFTATNGTFLTLTVNNCEGISYGSDRSLLNPARIRTGFEFL